ncbi:MAG: hypothetical protein U0936_06235 [Planctomycetaceae bacterium]
MVPTESAKANDGILRITAGVQSRLYTAPQNAFDGFIDFHNITAGQLCCSPLV